MATAGRGVSNGRTESLFERLADLVYSDLCFLLHAPHRFGFVTMCNPDWAHQSNAILVYKDGSCSPILCFPSGEHHHEKTSKWVSSAATPEFLSLPHSKHPGSGKCLLTGR